MSEISLRKQIDTPRLTANTLSEYITAKPAKQRKILESLKYPGENLPASIAHKEAREAIQAYFINDFDEKYITDCIDLLRGTKDPSDYQKRMIPSSIEVLESVLASYHLKSGFKFKKFNSIEIV